MSIAIPTTGNAQASLFPAGSPPTPGADLRTLLRERFGHADFRPYQEAACQAVTAGKDVLLVMPTGAGKSLCYQLPGFARGGTTLLVSPLIALMEDQVEKLQRQGFRAERIHSGRERAESRAVCRAYLDGQLDFLFIAPERLAVPGFPEMLAKRRPSLVAVDEAHCISAWGHDFRPEYRMLGERLPMLRPAPIVAVTATATPLVQDDIVVQLGIGAGLRFIHGFRRTNIAIEVVECPPSARQDAIERILCEDAAARRPAIVYAPSRKLAEELAARLAARFPARAYHAGMDAASRDEVQAAFQSGKLDVIVATIAFGMGIDKADVRTVIHAALPGSIEGYYQELGRAGRDGAPARAILLWSFADRRTHEFFQERDYPPTADLARLVECLPPEGTISSETLRARAGVRDESFEKALEKLWIHGGAAVDPEGNVARGAAGEEGWKRPYEAQTEHRLMQLQAISRYAETRHECRMIRLVRHFRDQEDDGRACGGCDVCAPMEGVALSLRRPSEAETRLLARLFSGLVGEQGAPTGRLYRERFETEGIDRRVFDRMLGALARAGLVSTQPDSFEKDGRRIDFVRARLTEKGKRAVGMEREVLPDVMVEGEVERAKGSKSASHKSRRPDAASAVGHPPQCPPSGAPPASSDDDAPPALVASLKAWRLEEAKRRRVPAFRILTDRVLHALAARRPTDDAGLLAISGIGPKIVEKSGPALLQLLR